ncbi:MAG: PAS domain S-box protein [Planctomycetes bacterium]|nr:PAS domain S-box protein [Planctomycetota bacterium]
MAGSITDITRRKEAEERLRRQALVFDNMYDGVLLTDLAGRIMDWNTGAERIFGYSRDEMLGQSPEMLNPPEVAAALTLSIQTALAVEGRWTGEVRLVRKDGTEGVCESFLVELQDEDGRRIGAVAVNRDITDRKKAEREKESLVEQLVQSAKMEAIGTLASGIAHQFDNLLTAISAYTDMAKTTLPPTHQAVRSLEKVEMTSRHARVVTNGLLDFSRPSSGRQSTLNLSQVVLDTVQMLNRVLDSRIEIDAKSVAQEQTWIRGNPTDMQQVLVNLAVNAQDAMPIGGCLRISLTNRMDESGSQSKRHAVLVVSDTGSGIAPQHLSRIFEPFFTTKPRGRGTGLGLPIIHRIVTDMGGKIQVVSEPGTGATMTITVPCCEAPTGAMQKDMRLPARKSPGHVIIIEKNPHVRSIMTTTLRGVGCEVRPVSRVDEAIDFTAKRPTQSNLIVMDLDSVTPKDFAKLTSLREQRADMRMIVIVGTLSIDLKRHRLEDCLLLRKPFDMPELTELVEDCLNSLSNQEGGNNGE